MSRNIAILTPCLRSFSPAFSPSHVIADQYRCLIRAGHSVTVFVEEGWDGPPPITGMVIADSIPSVYRPSHIHQKAHQFLEECLQGFDVILTHDLIRAPWMSPFREALTEMNDDRHTWLHWVHSVPSHNQRIPNLSGLNPKHKLVYPNASDAEKAGGRFGLTYDRVAIIPHIVDARILCDFDERLWRLTDALPGIVVARVVQVYPAAADRFDDKGVDKLIWAFSNLKRRGLSVCCLVVDSWSETHDKEPLERYRAMATRNGLDEDEFAFASEILPGFLSFDRKDVFKLYHLANLFINPTRGEAFGLTGPEACLAGGVIPVLNGDLSMLNEVFGGGGIYVNFGSFERNEGEGSEAATYSKLAKKIHKIIETDPNVVGRDTVRRFYNLDVVYEQGYKRHLEG